MNEGNTAVDMNTQDNVTEISPNNVASNNVEEKKVKRKRKPNPLVEIKKEIKVLKTSLAADENKYKMLQDAATQMETLEARIPETRERLEELTEKAMELMKADLGLD